MSSKASPTTSSAQAAIRAEVIGFFVEALQTLGLPKSLGEIYALIFLSPEAVSMAEISEQLGISMGTTSQGLRQLRQLKAVRVVYQPGERRDYFTAETELRQLTAHILTEVMQPRIEAGRERIARATAELPHLPKATRSHYQHRMAKLRHWNEASAEMLPLLAKWIQ